MPKEDAFSTQNVRVFLDARVVDDISGLKQILAKLRNGWKGKKSNIPPKVAESPNYSPAQKLLPDTINESSATQVSAPFAELDDVEKFLRVNVAGSETLNIRVIKQADDLSAGHLSALKKGRSKLEKFGTVVVTGPKASGKTTVALLLAKDGLRESRRVHYLDLFSIAEHDIQADLIRDLAVLRSQHALVIIDNANLNRNLSRQMISQWIGEKGEGRLILVYDNVDVPPNWNPLLLGIKNDPAKFLTSLLRRSASEAIEPNPSIVAYWTRICCGNLRWMTQAFDANLHRIQRGDWGISFGLVRSIADACDFAGMSSTEKAELAKVALFAHAGGIPCAPFIHSPLGLSLKRGIILEKIAGTTKRRRFELADVRMAEFLIRTADMGDLERFYQVVCLIEPEFVYRDLAQGDSRSRKTLLTRSHWILSRRGCIEAIFALSLNGIRVLGHWANANQSKLRNDLEWMRQKDFLKPLLRQYSRDPLLEALNEWKFLGLPSKLQQFERVA
jgi:energy-coupling factor transporter ATP-binding protein EcfA2